MGIAQQLFEAAAKAGAIPEIAASHLKGEHAFGLAIFGFWICCFSLNGNDLGQWRNYADQRRLAACLARPALSRPLSRPFRRGVQRVSPADFEIFGTPRAIRMGPVDGKHRSVRAGPPLRRAEPRGGPGEKRVRWPRHYPGPRLSAAWPASIVAQGQRAGRGRLGGAALIGNNELLLATQRRLASADRTVAGRMAPQGEESAMPQERRAGRAGIT